MTPWIVLGVFAYPIIGFLVGCAGYRYSKQELREASFTDSYGDMIYYKRGKSLYGLSWVGPSQAGSNARITFTTIFWPLIVLYISFISILWFPAIAFVVIIRFLAMMAKYPGVAIKNIAVGLLGKRVEERYSQSKEKSTDDVNDNIYVKEGGW